MNVLNHAMAPEMENILNKVENDSNIRAAILISGKPDSFIAGADIKMLVRRNCTFLAGTLLVDMASLASFLAEQLQNGSGFLCRG